MKIQYKQGGYFILMIFIVLNKLQHLQCMESFFRLEFEETAVDKSINATFIEKTQSELECYMSCLNKNGKCCLLAIKEERNQLECLMYGITPSKAAYHYEMNSKIASMVDCKLLKDCKMLREEGNIKDGVYSVAINGTVKEIFCDMTTEGGGWTVIQKRLDGSVDFNRSWNEYKNGFGDVAGEHWLGNEFIHQLTKGRSDVLLRIEAETSGGLVKYITLRGFLVGNESSKYELRCPGTQVGGDGGIVGSWMIHGGAKFSTKDADNDNDSGSCSQTYGDAGWWYYACYQMNLNGLFVVGQDNAKGMTWTSFDGFTSLKTTKMQMK